MINFIAPNRLDMNAFNKYFNVSLEKGQYSNFGPCERLLKEKFEALSGCDVVLAANATLILDGLHRILEAETVLLPSFTFPATNQGCTSKEVFYSETSEDEETMGMAIYRNPLNNTTAGYAITVNPFGSNNLCKRPNCYYWIVDNAAGTIESTKKWIEAGADAVVMSLHATKILSACEGGVVFFKKGTTGATSVAELYFNFINFGFIQKEDGSRVAASIGSNHKMSELSAAACLANLEVYDEEIIARKFVADKYQKFCLESKIPHIYSLQAFWVLGKCSNLIVQKECKNIGLDVRPYYSKLYNSNKICQVTTKFVNQGFCLPTRRLDLSDLDFIINALKHLEAKGYI